MKIKIISLLLLITVLVIPFTSCLSTEQIHVADTPPINVNLASSNVTGSTSITQNVTADPRNSSSANLTAGATFTGLMYTTLGVAGIQVSLKTDQNCTVYVEQSSDALNWDIVDMFHYIYSLGGNSWTVQAVQSFYRVRVTNNGLVQTTYFRLQTCLCPIVEAVPRSLNEDGRLKTVTTLEDKYGFNAEFTPFNELRIAQTIKLAGTVFIGSTLDTNFVATNTTNGGTVTQTGGQMVLQTNTTANGYAEAFSVRRGRFVAGESNMAKLVIQIPDLGLTNNIRRWGIGDLASSTNMTVVDGAYFYIDGATFGVATMRGGVTTNITSGFFNGTHGATYTLDNDVHEYEIYYSTSMVYFSLDGELLETVDASATPWTNTVTLYIGMDNQNYNGTTTNRILYCRSFSISRLGQLISAPIYRHISTSSTNILKYGAGTLHSLTINNPSNATITIYDNTSATGNIIAIIVDKDSYSPQTLTYELDFYTGLTIVTSATIDITLAYE